MGILDEAIREHLELKRQHGAGDSELKELEDEAFGPPARPGEEDAQPDPFAEAPTEFMTAPPAGSEPQEEPKAGEPEAAAEEKPTARREPVAEVQEAPQAPAEEEHPAMEHEAVTEPPAEEPTPEPSTEERERLAIASQPTEMYDVEGEITASEPAPSEEELLEEEMNEPRLAPVDPPIDAVEVERVVEEEEEEDDDFFDERRLSEELDQALEGPVEEDEFAELGEVEEEDEGEFEEEDEFADEEEEDESPVGRRGNDEDVLEDTPDFLEDSEDDQLWFEQKPPKDFDFDD